MISNIFKEFFGQTVGPEVQIFKRCRKQWPKTDKANFTLRENVLFDTSHLLELREEMYKYYSNAIQNQQPRADYFELLMLCRLFLADTINKLEFTFRAPGAVTMLVGWQNPYTA